MSGDDEKSSDSLSGAPIDFDRLDTIRERFASGNRCSRIEVSIHYHEEHGTSEFDHWWDRHPSDHNTRDHVHPGPDAPMPGDDTSHPIDCRDILSMVLSEIEERQRAFWEE